MLKKLLKYLLKKAEKNYSLDETIPDSLVFSILSRRFIMIVRGVLKTRQKIFIGKRVKIYNKRNFRFGKNCTIEENVILDCYAKKGVELGDSTKIGLYSVVSITSHLSKHGEGLNIGSNSAIGGFSYFGCSGGVEIGNDVIMGEYISFHSENHNFQDKSKLIREQGVYSKGIIIGNNIWVGSKVTFLDGCVIGDNTVVAAGAVVKGIFPPNVIIGGIPAKVIKEI